MLIDKKKYKNKNNNNNLTKEKNEKVFFCGPKSQLGRRLAYTEICNNQLKYHNKCNISLYSLLCCYNIEDIKKYTEKTKLKILNIDNDFDENHILFIICETSGIIIDPIIQKFRTTNYVFTKYAINRIINLCPSIPIDYKNERSVYSTLILHCPYPMGGEINILSENNNKNVFMAYNNMEKNNLLPNYLSIFHNKVKHTENLLKIVDENTNKENFDNNSDMDSINDNISCIDNNNEDDNSLNENIFDNDNNIENDVNNDVINNINDDNILEHTNFCLHHNNFKDMEHNTKQYITYNDIFYQKNYKNFVGNEKAKAIQYMQNEVQLNNKELNDLLLNYKTTNTNNNSLIIDVNDKANRLLTLTNKINDMKNDMNCKNQLEVINILNKYLENSPFEEKYGKSKQFIGFVSGQGGTGKSEIIKLITESINISYGKVKGKYGQTINVGPTGSSGIFYFLILYNNNIISI